MNSLGQIIAMNAHAAGKVALAFTVYVTVDPKRLREYAEVAAHEPLDLDEMADIVAAEIESNLDGNDWVESSSVRPKKIW